METEDIDLCKEPALSPDGHNSSTKGQPDTDSSNTGKNEANNKAGKSGENLENEPNNTKESSETTCQPREKSQSPEAPCSICLGKVENKSFTDSCFHTFCFVCLVEWSKVKPVCPLCKQPFKSIIHNVRSNEDYDQYHLESREAAENLRTSSRDQERFRYRTTLTHQNWIERQLELQRRQLEMLQRPSVTTARSMWSRQRQASTSAFRKRIYTMGMRVSEVRTACGRPLRQREVSPAFFRRNPACIHRLVPWLNRELNVLLHNLEDNVQFVLELIMDLLKRFDIQSEEFAEHLRSFLGQRTEHFIHEFYTFSRAPYDMVAYDSYAVYNLGNNSTEPQQISSSPSSSDDSVVAVDVIASLGNARTAIDNSVIVLNSDDEEVIPGQQSSLHQPPSAPAALSQTRMDSLLDPVRSFLSSVPQDAPQWVWESPPIHIDWRAPSTSDTVLTLTGDSVLDLSIPSTSHQVSDANGASNSMNYLDHVESTSTPMDESDPVHVTDLAGSSPLLSVKVEYNSDAVSSYGSELEIVGYEKPYDERSPVHVSSAGEQELMMLEIRRKKKLKVAEASRTRSTSSSSSETRKARRRKRKTKTRSRSRHRSSSASPSYFKEYNRKRRKSRSRKSNRRSRSRQRGDRSRSRSRRSRSRHRRSRSRQRHERSYSRRSDTSRRSRQRSRSRKRRHSRSHSRRIERTTRSNSRSHNRSKKNTNKSRSGSRTRRSKKRSRSRSKPKRSRRRSRSVSVEYCALGRYDVPSTRRERESEVGRNRRQKSPSYTYEWVHGRRSVETVGVRRRRDSSSSGSSSIVCITGRAGTDRRRMIRRKTSESIEVVYDSKRKSKKRKSEKEALRKQHKHSRKRSRSVSVDWRRRSVDKQRSREERSETREVGEKVSCKKHPTGHKGISKASVATEDTTRH